MGQFFEATPVDMTPEFLEVVEIVKGALIAKNRDKFEAELPYHILNTLEIVKWGSEEANLMTAPEDDLSKERFHFELHEMIYRQNMMSLGKATNGIFSGVGTARNFDTVRFHFDRLFEAYNNAIEKIDKFQSYNKDPQCFEKLFSIIACATACYLTGMFDIDARPSKCERLFPFASRDLHNTGFPMNRLV